MNFRLHPDAVPKKDDVDPAQYSSLAEFALELISKEGWTRHFEVLRENDSDIVRISYRPSASEEDTRDPPIVYMGSNRAFREGGIHRADIRSELSAFLRQRKS